jgi:hypothetical protein
MRLEGLGQFKKSNDFIGTWTRGLPACSIVPEPTTLPRAHPYFPVVYFVINRHTAQGTELLFEIFITWTCLSSAAVTNYNQLSPSNLVLLEILIVATPPKKFPDISPQFLPILNPLILRQTPILVLWNPLEHYPLILSGFFPSICVHSSRSCVLHALLSLTISPPGLDHSARNDIWIGVQVTELPIMQFSRDSCHFTPLLTAYVLPSKWQTKLQTHWEVQEQVQFCYFNL